MISTKPARTEQLDLDVALARHSLRFPVLTYWICHALFTNSAALKKRLDFGGRPALIAAHQIIAAAKFVELHIVLKKEVEKTTSRPE